MADGAAPIPVPRKNGMDSKAKIESHRRRYDTLKHATERTNCEAHWQDIGEVISPRKIDFVGMRTAGEKKMNKVYDPTGIMANEMLAAGLHGMATNPSSKWFSLRMVGSTTISQDGKAVDLNDDPEVQKYLAHVEEIMWQRLYQPGTNFTTALHEIYLDLGAFGTAVLFVGQRDDVLGDLREVGVDNATLDPLDPHVDRSAAGSGVFDLVRCVQAQQLPLGLIYLQQRRDGPQGHVVVLVRFAVDRLAVRVA